MRLFDCSRCSASQALPATVAGTPMHTCPGRRGMSVPLTPAGEHHDVRLITRDDYVGAEHVQTDDDGTPIMRAEVHRPDGRVDVWVYATTATGSAHAAG